MQIKTNSRVDAPMSNKYLASFSSIYSQQHWLNFAESTVHEPNGEINKANDNITTNEIRPYIICAHDKQPALNSVLKPILTTSTA